MPGFLSEALTWNENYSILLAVETALELKQPPLDFIRPNRKDLGQWSGLDKKLAMAHKIMEKETCGLCGNPIWICRNEDNNVDFSIRVGTCHSKSKMEKNEASRSKRKNGKLKEGQYLYSVPMNVDGTEIAKGARAAYYENLSKE